ncbi:hypothetical protein ABDD95_00710 [Mucilaginibacter sp. PAMB04274]|uniref:hypothetical protein n=1 Tax=Mucilaginibacter sp. PAMB04274 TaxID=3138568 RepID=UPI0031F6493C
METNRFENWKPKGEWVYDKTGSTFIGCHCATPYDDCGCDDCQDDMVIALGIIGKTDAFMKIGKE